MRNKNNPFILAGYNAVQATQLYEIASKYEDVGINADEAAQMIINATYSSAKLRNELKKIGGNVITREHIKTQIEECFDIKEKTVATSECNGRKIYYDHKCEQWKYCDTNTPIAIPEEWFKLLHL